MATALRSSKRRKVNPKDETVPTATAASSTTATSKTAYKPAKGTRKQPPRHSAQAVAKGQRTSSRLAGRRAEDLDKADVYDDSDRAFNAPPGKHLQSEAAAAREKRPTRQKKEPPAEPKQTKATTTRAKSQSGVTRTNSRLAKARSDDSEHVGGIEEERYVKKHARRGHGAPKKKIDTAEERKNDAEDDEDRLITAPVQTRSSRARAVKKKPQSDDEDELAIAPVQTRRGRTKAAVKEREAAAPKTRAKRRRAESRHEGHDGHGEKAQAIKKRPESRHKGHEEETRAVKKPARKPRPMATGRAAAKGRLLDVVGQWDDTSEDGVDVTLEITGPDSPSEAAQPESVPNQAAAGHVSEDTLMVLKGKVLSQIVGKAPVPLMGLKEAYKKVYLLLEDTIDRGQSDSMLIIGTRGSGKTALVEQVLGEFSKARPDDFYTVRLTGIFQTDDNMAIREIWRQLGEEMKKEMDIEEDSTGSTNSDITNKLLALLSHAHKPSGEESDNVTKAVVIVIDEIDKFAISDRQFLLYNLFDIAKSDKVAIAVLGLTTHTALDNEFEKRVKSRFSQRPVYLSHASSTAQFREMCKSALTVRSKDLSESEQAALAASPAAPQVDVLTAWNDSVASVFSNHDVQLMMDREYILHKNVSRAIFNFYVPIVNLTPCTFPLTPAHITKTDQTSHHKDSKVDCIKGLNGLAQSLLIVAARCKLLMKTDKVSFTMARSEYQRVFKHEIGMAAVADTRLKRKYIDSEPALRGSWQELISNKLIIPDSSKYGVGAEADNTLMKCDVELEEIGQAVKDDAMRLKLTQKLKLLCW